jgi:hypothetical protein
MSGDLEVTIIEMVLEWPVRSAITVIGPQLFAIGQLVNSYYHDISLVYPAMFAVLLVGMSILILQQQFAEFHSDKLKSEYF